MPPSPVSLVPRCQSPTLWVLASVLLGKASCLRFQQDLISGWIPLGRCMTARPPLLDNPTPPPLAHVELAQRSHQALTPPLLLHLFWHHASHRNCCVLLLVRCTSGVLSYLSTKDNAILFFYPISLLFCSLFFLLLNYFNLFLVFCRLQPLFAAASAMLLFQI